MTKIKGIICTVGLLMCGFILGSYSYTAEARTDALFEETYTGSDGICDTYILTDKGTKVEYIVVTADTYRGQSCSITPRLKSDGSLYSK